MEEIQIHTAYIQLQQLLKWLGVAENGSIAKEMCREGVVMVNGNVETAPGKKLYSGDIITMAEQQYQIVTE